MYQVCQWIYKIYKAEIDWSSLLIYGDLYYIYSVSFQPSLFAHKNSRYIYHTSNRKSENQSLSNSSFLVMYVDTIQMVLDTD